MIYNNLSTNQDLQHTSNKPRSTTIFPQTKIYNMLPANQDLQILTAMSMNAGNHYVIRTYFSEANITTLSINIMEIDQHHISNKP